MNVPDPTGPLSARVSRHLTSPGTDPLDLAAFDGDLATVVDPLSDHDFQLALACLYELHYRGFDDADDSLEWDGALLAARGRLERRFEEALTALVGSTDAPGATDDVDVALRRLVDVHDGPSLSTFMLRTATLEQYRDLVRQRSVYHLKEADPHTWTIPRLAGRAKAALIEIQSDEYGGGNPRLMHSTLFADTMRALDLDDTYGAYWDGATAETFATVNLMSMFGLHRRLRGAAVGHLAALEMTSTVPNRRYANGLRRLEQSATATAFFDVHVEADAVHEQLAAVDMCGNLVADEPALTGQVLWGAACCLALDQNAGNALLARWQAEGDRVA